MQLLELRSGIQLTRDHTNLVQHSANWATIAVAER